MDSGNSSSMQSSSGGDEHEYDSRSLFHNIMKQPPQQQQQQPLPHFLQPQLFNWAPAPLLRPDPDTNFLSFTAAPGTSTAPPPSASSPVKPPPQPKNPKKRTRASRRAPTTVLTTDTTNFRAMVQEFTGIPDPPFSSSACSRRLDLLSTAGSSMRLGSGGPGPPFRPAAQRLPPTSFLGGVMNQDALSGVGSGQSDPTLAFQQPFLFPPPNHMNSSAFGINMGGLLLPSQNLSSGVDPPQPGNGIGFVSSSEPDHGRTNNNPNNNYLTSQAGNAEYRNQ